MLQEENRILRVMGWKVLLCWAQWQNHTKIHTQTVNVVEYNFRQLSLFEVPENIQSIQDEQ